MKDVISREDMIKALGEKPEGSPSKSADTLTLKGIAETVSHNANIAQRVNSDLAAEITMTNLVVKHIMRALDLKAEDIVKAATDELSALNRKDEKDDRGDLPPEATIFGS